MAIPAGRPALLTSWVCHLNNEQFREPWWTEIATRPQGAASGVAWLRSGHPPTHVATLGAKALPTVRDNLDKIRCRHQFPARLGAHARRLDSAAFTGIFLLSLKEQMKPLRWRQQPPEFEYQMQ
jgi:hypothetical protein